MIQRPSQDEYTPIQARYVSLVPEGSIIEILTGQSEYMRKLLSSVSEDRGNFRYADGKWSLKQVAGHVADNERIMSYRLLRAARGDRTPLTGYDQDVLMSGSPFQGWSVADVIEDYSAARGSTLTLLRGLQDQDWLRKSVVNGSEVSARAWAYIIAGHERHHLNVIEERYLGK